MRAIAKFGLFVVGKRLKPNLKPKNIMSVKHINEIKLKGKNEFVKKFNHCSNLFQKAHDKSLSEKEKDNFLAEYIAERQRLEFGL